jgi:hypothetical protein
MEVIHKNDSGLDSGVLPANTGIVAFAVRDTGLDGSPGMVELFRSGLSRQGE